MAKNSKSSIEADNSLLKGIASTQKGSGKKINIQFTDPFNVVSNGSPLTKDDQRAHSQALGESSELIKSVLNVLNGPGDSIERLAFETNPSVNNTYQSLWKRKLRLLPDELLKRISIQDDLVASICNTRSNQVAAFGRPQPDRFSTGYQIEPKPGYTEHLDGKEKEELTARIAKAEALLLTCGQTSGWDDNEAMNFSQFLKVSARNAMVFGRTATEIVHVEENAQKRFHSFRPIDAGTIFKAAPYKEAAEKIRETALHTLRQLKNDSNIQPERYVNDEYVWVQVIEGRAFQAFTAQECVVHNFYPCTDVELDGYPVTPLDTIIAAVTMHINITTHNKLYFQSGRATKGMIIFKSDDVDENITSSIRQQFNASINSVGNAWRMPVFGVGTNDAVEWTPIDSSSRDMEFQYLSDSNARVILSAFQMSPEEIPGYAHLSRGTNSQALSESNNEFKLEAHRDVGIRPMLAEFQNFVNAKILPLIDPELSNFCSFKFVGLDAETAEKEAIRISQEMALHMTIDEVLEKVEKKAIGKRWGGHVILNPQWHQLVADKYLMVGDILEHFFGVDGASKDPRYQYIRDPFFFQWMQLQQQQQQMQLQAQQPQQQPGQPGQDQQQGQPDAQAGQQDQQQDLTRSIDQLANLLSKSEKNLPASKKRLLVHERRIVENALAELEDEAKKAIKEIVDVAEQHLPLKYKKE